MTANVTPSVFHFESEATIRAIVIDGNPWFVAKDVIKALQLTNPTMSIKSLDDDERAKFNLGRQGETNIISESGLYTLILRCRDAVTPALSPTAFVNGLQVRFFLRSAAPEVTLKTRSRRKNA